MHDLQQICEQVAEAVAPLIGTGRVADYIPALACVDPRKFGMAVVTVGGEVVTVGDADEPFSIQSISKVFTLTMAAQRLGAAKLRGRVGVEPSGTPFNSIVQLEAERGIPRNPLINAGAIVVTDALLAGRYPMTLVEEIVAFMRARAHDPSVGVDRVVAMSEARTGSRNRALANFMAAFGNMESPVEDALAAYFHQCALALSCRQLARAGLYFAAEGRDPLTGEEVLTPEQARRIASIMLRAGHYDASGEFAFRVGLPGKSGVGGGILAIAPGRAAIAVWSPGLNDAGNSLVGTAALEAFTRLAGWSVFGHPPSQPVADPE